MYYHPHEEEGVLPFERVIKWIAGASALFALLLVGDYLLPANCSDQFVRDKLYRKESTRFGEQSYDLKIITPELQFAVSPELFGHIAKDAQIQVCKTPLLGTVKQISGISGKNEQAYIHDTELPIYRGFGAFPVSLLIASLVCLFFKNDDTVAYTSGILSIILLITMLAIL